jgi:outer membrane protein assembly factor BamB
VTTTGSDEGQRPDAPQPSNGLWLVCPVCKKLNPAGTEFCKHCWGASLNSAEPMPYKEAMAFAQLLLQNKKKYRMTWIALFIIIPLLITVGSALLYIYSYTDLLWGPYTALNSNSTPGDWAMFRGNLGRTGATDNSTTQPQGVLAWSFQTGGEIHSSPAVVNGVVYFGSEDYNFYAVDAATGIMHWEFKTGSYVNSSPAVVNGIVYFGSNDGYFYALDAVTGHELWVFKTRYGVESSPAVADGKVYFGGDDGFVYCLNAENGKKIWTFRTNGWVISSPAIVNGLLYVGSSEDSLYVLNANDGRFRLKFGAASSVFASPAVNNGEAYFTGQSDGVFYGVNGKGRTWPWEGFIRPLWLEGSALDIAPMPPPISGLPWRIGLFLTPNNQRAVLAITAESTSIVTDSNIYTTGSNLVYNIDKTTHKALWVFQARNNITSSPALANNVIYIGSSDGYLYAIDAQSGTKLWDYATGGTITSSPAQADGVIYFGSNDGKMYAVK